MIRAIQLLNHTPVVCKMRFHGYYFNWASFKTDWEGTVIGKYKFMKSPQYFRNHRRILPRIVEGGWHFSYMGGTEKMLEKMNAAVECKELVVKDERFLEKDFVEKIRSEGKYIFGEQFSPCDIEQIDIPYLKKFLNKYPYFVQNKI